MENLSNEAAATATNATAAPETAAETGPEPGSFEHALAAFRSTHALNQAAGEPDKVEGAADKVEGASARAEQEKAAEPKKEAEQAAEKKLSRTEEIMARAAEAKRRREAEAKQKELEERESKLQEQAKAYESDDTRRAVETLKDRRATQEEKWDAMRTLGFDAKSIVDALEESPQGTSVEETNASLDLENHPHIKALQAKLEEYEKRYSELEKHQKEQEQARAENQAKQYLQGLVDTAKEQEPDRWRALELVPDYTDHAIRLAREIYANSAYQPRSEELLDLLNESIMKEIQEQAPIFKKAVELGFLEGFSPARPPETHVKEKPKPPPPTSPAVGVHATATDSAETFDGDYTQLAIREFRKAMGR